MENKIEENYIKITDATLREVDQSPFTSFNANEKVIIALMLTEMWVDTIEVWFWFNPSDFDNIKKVWKVVWDRDVVISSLWRVLESDTISSLEALVDVNNPRIHMFVAMSEEHIKWKFQKEWESFKNTQEKILKNVIYNIKLVKKWEKENNKKTEIEFSPEDATWNALVVINNKKYFKLYDNPNFDFLVKACEQAIRAWVTVINVPDTLWNLTPSHTYDFFKELTKRLSYLKSHGYKFGLSSHIHNDLGMATANTIEAIRWWAKYVETTMLWMWERTWNSPTEEIAGIISEKWHDLIKWREILLNPKFKTELMWPISDFVKKIVWFEKSMQRPFVWPLSDSDGSWVHKANDELYGWSKNKKKFGWAILPEFFSPRWWSNQIVSILQKHGIDESKKTIDKLMLKFWQEAELTKALYANNVYSTYLRENKRFNINKLNIENNSLDLELTLNWKEIKFNWEVEWDNGVINTFINLINQNIWTERVKIKDLVTKSKANLWQEIENFKHRVWDILSTDFNEKIDNFTQKLKHNNEYSQSIAISQVVLEVDWREVYSISSDHNTSRAEIKAILEGIIDIL